MPTLVVIGGPNGSGKTTATTYLTQKGRIKTEVVNPDEIALKELGGFSNAIAAAKIALHRRADAIAKKQDLAFETTFSGNSEINNVLIAKEVGYKVILYYICLPSVIDNIIRIEGRQAELGHKVTKADTIRRFEKSRQNLIRHIGLFDNAYLFDNSGAKRSRVAIFKNGKLLWLNSKQKNHPFYKELFT